MGSRKPTTSAPPPMLLAESSTNVPEAPPAAQPPSENETTSITPPAIPDSPTQIRDLAAHSRTTTIEAAAPIAANTPTAGQGKHAPQARASAAAKPHNTSTKSTPSVAKATKPNKMAKQTQVAKKQTNKPIVTAKKARTLEERDVDIIMAIVH
jgi:hypothetical protein